MVKEIPDPKFDDIAEKIEETMKQIKDDKPQEETLEKQIRG